MKLLLPILLFSGSAFAQEAVVKCDYAFMGMPTTSVQFAVYKGDELGPSVTVTMQGGQSHKETLTQEVTATDEYAHGWISKENPQNTIELIVYKADQPQGRSKLVNHNVPIGKEMWGTCAGIPEQN